jgi:hypothetical protein
MSNKVTFGIGIERNKAGEFIPSADVDRLRDEALEVVARAYGGYSAREVSGGWFSPDLGKIIRERSILVETFTELGIEEHRRVAGQIRELLNQESVLVSIQKVESLEFV